jgi:hypothetical protein
MLYPPYGVAGLHMLIIVIGGIGATPPDVLKLYYFIVYSGEFNPSIMTGPPIDIGNDKLLPPVVRLRNSYLLNYSFMSVISYDQ